MPSLGATFGRGAATLPQWDLARADCVLIMGSNMAENHPIAFRFAMQARQNGATIIHADPRFTRTSAMADIYAPLRAGSDIAFLGGIIRHVLENDLWFRDFALPYTNLSTIIDEDYQGPEELAGMFSGWSEETKRYSPTSWQYEGLMVPSSLAESFLEAEGFAEATKRLHDGPTPKDPTLQHPRCVYQILKRHFARYTPEMVEQVTGCPRETFLQVADAMARNSGRERTGTICYAVGWTHHSTGVQIIRASAILQGLLGNVGRPGGGILALRGHTSIQGSTDIPTLYDMLPGYMPQPHAMKPHGNFADYLEAETSPTGWWNNFPKYATSLMRAWYGDAGTKENGFGFDFLQRMTGDHSQLPMTVAMRDGIIKGLFVMGQNPVVGGSNSRLVQRGLAKLDWLVVRDFAETETANFWRDGHIIRDGEMKPEEIGTEVFLMPASLSGEKAGSFTNTHRLIQWHDKVVDAPGESRSELWFTYHLGRLLKEAYATSTRDEDRPIQALTWDYPVDGEGEPDAEAVLREINGYTWPEKTQISGFADLKDDGSTACGCWIYSGVFPEAGKNLSRARKPDGPDGPGTHLGWGFAWPDNRRTLNNRASADPVGEPWSARKKLVWWDAAAEKWDSPDKVDFPPDKRPDFEPDWDSKPAGIKAHRGDQPFIMLPDGVIGLFVPSGLKDGPLPAHYEPIESPVHNALYAQDASPAAKRWEHGDNPLHETDDPRYPHVLTTYRLTEHHAGGTPTRSVATTAELMPEGFCEIPTELALALGIRNTEWVVLSTARGEVETRALVTDRLRPFRLGNRLVWQLGMPWHFGWEGFATGDIANVLTAVVGDANTAMHENKALTCALRPGRIARGGGS